MKQTVAFLIYYIKIISKDKITLLWSILFPLVLALLSYLPQKDNFGTLNEKIMYLSIFWSFTLIMIFINGIGAQTSVIRQHGLLKTFYSISGKKYPFLLSIIISQIIMGIIAVTINTVVLGGIMNIISLKLFTNMLLYMIFVIPLTPAFLIIAFVPVKSESLSTIINITTIILFFITGNTSNNFNGLEWINPVYFFMKLSLFISGIHTTAWFPIVVIFPLYLIIGSICLFKLDINSKIQRT
ncbi:hypothetical protein NSA33_06035 [Mammaliicoccus lentus]|uniref:hypothetical protein n=1 Tax=Mammaliicoccus lentus TaxID=42858 RepID=UPI00214B8F10|nr:hypothetical protein [Mammaliicoccus lentus]MCR1872720.1 hypothetical protein [Mammaliicoccus lentus]